jgi:hypothetical protein
MSDPTPESFAAVADLIRLIADPDGAARRLRELQKLVDQAEKAQARLDADRTAHEQKVAADNAALDKREAAARQRVIAATIRENSVAEREARWRDEKPGRWRDPNLSGTIERAEYHE